MRFKDIRSSEFREKIDNKLRAELEKDFLSVVDEPPLCCYAAFCALKDGGGGRVIIDCSKPRVSQLTIMWIRWQ